MINKNSSELDGVATLIFGLAIDEVTAAQTAAGQTIIDQDGARIMPELSVPEVIHFTLSGIVAPVVCLLGMAGNLLSVVTWSRPGMSGATGRYLTGQAVANFFALFFFLLVESVQYNFPIIRSSSFYGEFFAYFGFPIFYFAVVCSIWFTVGVTVDRYIMICWITKSKNLCSASRATFSLALISVLAFLVNIPHFVFFRPVYHDNNNNNTSYETAAISFAASQFQLSSGGQIYEFWIHCVILIAGPWVSVFYMNATIIIKLNLTNKSMASKKTVEANKKSKESESQITRLLLTVTFAFLFFNGITCIVQCLWANIPPAANVDVLFSSLAFAKISYLLNSSLNFIFYCLSGRRFRKELLKMFGYVSKDGNYSSSKDVSSINVATISTTATNTSVNAIGI